MEEAAARRERLKALKAAAALAEAGDDDAAPPPAEQERPTLKFRNYVVKDKQIEHEQVGGARRQRPPTTERCKRAERARLRALQAPPAVAARAAVRCAPPRTRRAGRAGAGAQGGGARGGAAAGGRRRGGAPPARPPLCSPARFPGWSLGAGSSGGGRTREPPGQTAGSARISRPRPSDRAACPPPPTLQELLASVAPKKANFDLKREIQPKLDKLERRTLRALVEIMQQARGGRGGGTTGAARPQGASRRAAELQSGEGQGRGAAAALRLGTVARPCCSSRGATIAARPRPRLPARRRRRSGDESKRRAASQTDATREQPLDTSRPTSGRGLLPDSFLHRALGSPAVHSAAWHVLLANHPTVTSVPVVPPLYRELLCTWCPGARAAAAALGPSARWRRCCRPPRPARSRHMQATVLLVSKHTPGFANSTVSSQPRADRGARMGVLPRDV
jgi:hypothetical protein